MQAGEVPAEYQEVIQVQNLLAEGIRAGLVQVEFTAETPAQPYRVTISNGSGTKTVDITAKRASVAHAWGTRWAASIGAGWQVTSLEGGPLSNLADDYWAMGE